ncbi:orotate phosphoribosyltransferase [Loigolactobacillus binensis]|uniref:Orotate phosphoribosyltransferase n=1 Tax=Loigolactobacillus binensis TaxID=2559922 RepID=A0ABW3EDQ9_9LACO|nr:orotate phosphoribosyltransferase [Loigolactobacillus binensis]
MTTTETKIATDLLAIKAVTLRPEQPFTWASGIKSPIYTDNRLTISYPGVRRHIAKALVQLIRQHFPEVEVIAGTATAGIPHAAWVAAQLDLPMIYVRSKPKDHGQGRQIEGKIAAGAKVVVIDDLISTGGSVLKAVTAAQNEGAIVLGVCGIFSYELAASTTNFAAAGIPFYTLTNYTALVETAIDSGMIDQAKRELLHQWRRDPEHWGK